MKYVIIGGSDITSKMSSHTRQIAQVMDVELGSEPLSRATLTGVIRIVADAKGFGNYIDIDKTFDELISTGFVVAEEG